MDTDDYSDAFGADEDGPHNDPHHHSSALLPMTPANSAFPMTPMAELPPMTPMIDDLLSASKRQRSQSSVGDKDAQNAATTTTRTTRPTSESFDMSVDNEFEELWASLKNSDGAFDDDMLDSAIGEDVDRQISAEEQQLKQTSSSSSSRVAVVPSSNDNNAGDAKQAGSLNKSGTGGAVMAPPPLPSTRQTNLKPGMPLTMNRVGGGGASMMRPMTRPSSGEDISEMAPGPCSKEERRAKIARFVEKRSRRIWTKEIKYSCRKQFAESRPRIAGRFIPKPSDSALVSTLWGIDLTAPSLMLVRPRKMDVVVIVRDSNQSSVHLISGSETSSSDSEDEEDEEQRSRHRQQLQIDWDRETLIMPKRIKAGTSSSTSRKLSNSEVTSGESKPLDLQAVDQTTSPPSPTPSPSTIAQETEVDDSVLEFDFRKKPGGEGTGDRAATEDDNKVIAS